MIAIEQALEVLVEAIAERVAARVEQRLAARAAPADELLTVAEFARVRSISQSTVRKYIRAKRVDVVRIGKAVRLRRDAELRPATGSVPTASAVAPSSMERALRLLTGGA